MNLRITSVWPVWVQCFDLDTVPTWVIIRRDDHVEMLDCGMRRYLLFHTHIRSHALSPSAGHHLIGTGYALPSNTHTQATCLCNVPDHGIHNLVPADITVLHHPSKLCSSLEHRGRSETQKAIFSCT